jgi:hypothetical protein
VGPVVREVVPPGKSWFAFDSNGKRPETLILPIWFLDNGVRSWIRSSVGALEETTKEQRLDIGQGAAHVWHHHGDPVEALGLDDARAALHPGQPLPSLGRDPSGRLQQLLKIVNRPGQATPTPTRDRLGALALDT